LKNRLSLLEQEMQLDDFWKDKDKAVKTSKEASDIKEEAMFFDSLNIELSDMESIFKIIEEDDIMYKELEDRLSVIERRIKGKETETYFNGKYDKGNAILSVYSGAGGQDAQDWAQILFRMYSRFCEKKDFKVVIIDESYGEGGGSEGIEGLKSITVEITGKFAYGLLKKEAGVHRLVRISPFSAQKLRHTSFALVEVLPQIDNNEDIGLKEEDMRIDFYKASGPGGQYVNKRESAVRVTHLPTGIVVTCQSERLQGSNKEKAIQVLSSKIYQYKLESQAKELSEIKGDKISASWGNQIRSYVLHPYKLVKDLRTGVEVVHPEEVLDGDLDEFIEEEIKQK
jgi:peptide chain release factor 2